MTHLYSIREQQLSAKRLGVDVTPLPASKRRARNNEESRSQQAVIKWWSGACRRFGVPELCLMAIPNAGWRSPVSGAIMKREGLRTGAPDLFLSVARQKPAANNGLLGMPEYHHGLFVEMKTAKGRVEPEQEVYHEILRNQGYRVEVARSAKEAADVMMQYLNP